MVSTSGDETRSYDAYQIAFFYANIANRPFLIYTFMIFYVFSFFQFFDHLLLNAFSDVLNYRQRLVDMFAVEYVGGSVKFIIHHLPPCRNIKSKMSVTFFFASIVFL